MIALIDEAVPALPGGLAYVVGSTVLLVDDVTAKAAIANVLTRPGRTRPFHWAREGATIRQNMIDCLIEIGAVAHVCVHHPTGRKKTEAAREIGLREVIPRLLQDGATTLLIESRAKQDVHDRDVILDILERSGRSGRLTYDWRDKTESLLWLPDAVCGAVSEFLLHTNDAMYYERLCQAGVIGGLIYVSGRSARWYA
jgi:hypothetical protein